MSLRIAIALEAFPGLLLNCSRSQKINDEMTLRKCCFEERIEFTSSVVKKIVVLRRELDIDLKKCLRDET